MKQFDLRDKEEKIRHTLTSYASGSGSISFVYHDKTGNCTGLHKPTKRDIEWYLEHRRPELNKSHKIGEVSSEAGFIIYRPCIRSSDDEIQMNGKTYRYKRQGFDLKVWCDDGMETKNISVKSALKFWLNHENELAE